MTGLVDQDISTNYGASSLVELADCQPTIAERTETGEIAWRPSSYIGSASKRVFDIVVSLLLIVLLLPLMMAVTIAVKATSPGPLIFRQERNGQAGRFRIYKFRTMYDRPDEIVNGLLRPAYRGDPRITPVGFWLRRLSLDEVPQILNVLRGEMSIVGPRPHAISHDGYFAQHVPGYLRRYEGKPGITGLAQVSGARGEVATPEMMADRLAFDLRYLREASLLLDLRMIRMTPGMIRDSKDVF